MADYASLIRPTRYVGCALMPRRNSPVMHRCNSPSDQPESLVGDGDSFHCHCGASGSGRRRHNHILVQRVRPGFVRRIRDPSAGSDVEFSCCGAAIVIGEVKGVCVSIHIAGSDCDSAVEAALESVNGPVLDRGQHVRIIREHFADHKGVAGSIRARAIGWLTDGKSKRDGLALGRPARIAFNDNPILFRHRGVRVGWIDSETIVSGVAASANLTILKSW
jgi:hypothetical protein